MFCARVLTHSFSVVFCIARAMHKFEFRLFKKETSKKLLPEFIKKLRHTIIDSHIFDKISKISSDRHGECKYSTNAVQVNSILLIKVQDNLSYNVLQTVFLALQTITTATYLTIQSATFRLKFLACYTHIL